MSFCEKRELILILFFCLFQVRMRNLHLLLLRCVHVSAVLFCRHGYILLTLILSLKFVKSSQTALKTTLKMKRVLKNQTRKKTAFSHHDWFILISTLAFPSHSYCWRKKYYGEILGRHNWHRTTPFLEATVSIFCQLFWLG